jgi:hypothetical protein
MALSHPNLKTKDKQKLQKNPDLHSISTMQKFFIISVKASFSMQQLHK